MQVVLQIIKYSVKKKIKIKYSVCGRLPNLAKTAGAITLYQLDGRFLWKKKYVPFLMQVAFQIIKYSVKKKIKIKYSACGRLPNLAKTAGAITLY